MGRLAMRFSFHALSWRWRARRFRRAPALPAILLYHSVGDRTRDPMHLAISPRRFAAHLAWLARHARPLPLVEFVTMHREGTLPANAVAVTFDDGYADNFGTAEALLRQAEIHATVFVTTDCIGGEGEGWWEELDAIWLETPVLPPVFRHRGFACEVEMHAVRDRVQWTVRQPPATRRERAFLAASAHARRLSRADRIEFMRDLRAWSGQEPRIRPGRAFATWSELRTAHRRGVLAIGAHTRSHPMLAARPRAEQRDEIAGSCAEIIRQLGVAPAGFAYPFGTYHDFTSGTRQLAARSGAGFACANLAARLGRDRWQLPRLLVGDWDPAELARRLGA